MSLRILLTAASLAALALPAAAQSRTAPADLLVDLAETLGRAHAVRTTCNGAQDSYWRNFMLNLMSIEAPSGSSLRPMLTDAFNRGYRGQNRETPTCTSEMPSIEASIARHGQDLTDSIARSYLN
jgi:uncharacterized protein (TIGR02301 family)